MLMFYNMGRIDAEAGTNAIFDPAAFTKHAAAIVGRLDDLAELPALDVEDVAADSAPTRG